jgi:HEPN domain-containing protein
MDQEYWSNVSKNFIDLYIEQEIKKRIAQGLVDDSFVLNGAQVIFDPSNDKVSVRLNREIQAQAQIKVSRPVIKGEPVISEDIEAITNLALLPSDGVDCGHFTMLKIKNGWSVYFDFRYHKGTCQKYIEAAKQFLNVAEFSRVNNFWNAFYDNAFSAAELAAKAVILSSSGTKSEKMKTHNSVKRKFNISAKTGNVPKKQSNILNKLSEIRTAARYVEKEIKVKDCDANEVMATLKEMIDCAESGIKTFSAIDKV